MKAQIKGNLFFFCLFTFQGVAEAELEKNLERTFKIFFSSSSERVSRGKKRKFSFPSGS